MGVNMTFYEPTETEGCFVPVARFGRIVSASRGDAPFDESSYQAVGQTVVRVPAVAGVSGRWWAVIAGQMHRVVGVRPLGPFFIFQTLTLEETDPVDITVVEPITIGDEPLTLNGEPLTACVELT